MASRYRAFISYSHKDNRHAKTLQRQLENLRLPASLAHAKVEQQFPLRPIFRDRSELAAAANLSAEIERALSAADYLIIVASPHAARSEWVAREVDYFKALGREAQILVFIPPNIAPDAEPATLLPKQARTGDPLAADARRRGDGRSASVLMLAARMLDVSFDDLARRHLRERNRKLFGWVIGTSAIALLTAGLALTVFLQSRVVLEQRNIAQQERDSAQATVDFLVDLFRVSASKQVNPEDVSALVLLAEGATQLQRRELEHHVRNQLALAMGTAFNNLGAYQDAVELLEETLSHTPMTSNRGVELRLLLADASIGLGHLMAAEEVVNSILTYQQTSVPFTNQRALALLQTQGALAYFSGQDRQAIEHYQLALQLAEASETPLNTISLIRGNLATAYRQLNELETARDLYSSVAEAYASAGNNPVNHANSLIGLAETLATLDQPQAAYETIERAIIVLDPVVPDVHPARVLALLTRASIRVMLGQFDAAIPDYDRTLQLVNELYGPQHMLTAEVLTSRAEASVRMNSHAAAAEAFDQALDITVKNFGEQSGAVVEHYLRRVEIWGTPRHVAARTEACQKIENMLALGNFTDDADSKSLYDHFQRLCAE